MVVRDYISPNGTRITICDDALLSPMEQERIRMELKMLLHNFLICELESKAKNEGGMSVPIKDF